MDPTGSNTAGSSPDSKRKSAKVAFVSGHIDLSNDTFTIQYKTCLDEAIRNGDNFILSNAGGADSMALEYLLSQDVSPSRITIYIHTPPARRQKPGGANETMKRIDRLRTGPETQERYRNQGLCVKVINGWHTERDAEMTRDSDYDILWVRPDDETKALYGKKYRPGRISGTQKNKDRREQMKENKEN